MPRKPICASCLFYFPARCLPIEVELMASPEYDGWCDHYEEERDKDEPVCEHYKKMKYRRRE